MDDRELSEHVHWACKSQGLLEEFDAQQHMANKCLDHRILAPQAYERLLADLIRRSTSDLNSRKALDLIASHLLSFEFPLHPLLASWLSNRLHPSFPPPIGRPSERAHKEAIATAILDVVSLARISPTRGMCKSIGNPKYCSPLQGSACDWVGFEIDRAIVNVQLIKYKTIEGIWTRYHSRCTTIFDVPPLREDVEEV